MSSDKIRTFTVTILGWEKHNGGKKKGHTHVLISTRFFDDHKVRALSNQDRCAYLWLLLRSGDEIGATTTSTAEQMRSAVGSTTLRVHSTLLRLQELQLLTIDKIEFLIDRKERNRKEEKIKEKKRAPVGAPIEVVETITIEKSKQPKSFATVVKPTVPPVSKIGQELVAVYCEKWKSKYGSSPPLRPQDTRQLKSFGEANGSARSQELLIAYLDMNESWFVRKRHDLATFLANLTSVAQFLETGTVLTKAKINSLESAQNLESTLKTIREEGI